MCASLILLGVGHDCDSGIALMFADGSETAEPVSAADLLPPEAPLVGPVGGPANSRNNNYGLHPILRTLAAPLSALGTAEQLRYSTNISVRSLAFSSDGLATFIVFLTGVASNQS